MELDVYALLTESPTLTFFLIVGLGYLVGQVQFRGFQLGPSTGVLFAALVFGHYGFEAPVQTESIGFILFIYCVGLQAGPQFFNAFREEGKKYIVLAVATAVVGGTLAFALSHWFAFDAGYSAGVLAGALTSTPTLVAARETLASGMAVLPDGVSADMAARNVTVSYAITYLFGLGGLVVLMTLLPRVLGLDLVAAAEEEAKRRQVSSLGVGTVRQAEMPILRVYRVTKEGAHGQSLRDLRFLEKTGCMIEKIKRGTMLIEPEPDSELHENDLVAVVGRRSELVRAAEFMGPEAVDSELLELAPVTRAILLTEARLVGQSLRDLDLGESWGCFVTKVTRAGIELPLQSELQLQKGDLLLVTGMKSRVERVADHIGQMERDVDETDLVTFAFGIAAGLVMGAFAVKLGNLSISLGSAGGLLIAGLVIGFLNSINPTIGRVPAAARYILMELGLLFFMAGIGVRAGGDIVSALTSAGPALILSGLVVMAVPALVAFVIGRYALGLHPVILLGAITGSMTSTPALAIVTSQSRSQLPVLGYAGTYTFANVFLAFAGSLMVRL